MASTLVEHKALLDVVFDAQEIRPRVHLLMNDEGKRTADEGKEAGGALEAPINKDRDNNNSEPPPEPAGIIAPPHQRSVSGKLPHRTDGFQSMTAARRSGSLRTLMRSKVDLVERSSSCEGVLTCADGDVRVEGPQNPENTAAEARPSLASSEACNGHHGRSKNVSFRIKRTSTSKTVVRDVVLTENMADGVRHYQHDENSAVTPTRSGESTRRRRSLDRRDDSTAEEEEDNGTDDSSPSTEQLEWLLDWLSSSSTTSDVQDLSSVDDIFHRRRGAFARAEEEGSAACAAAAPRPDPVAAPRGSEEEPDEHDDDYGDVDVSNASLDELREVVSKLLGTVKRKDDEISELRRRLSLEEEKHVERENEFGGLMELTEKLGRKLKRTSSNDRKHRKVIARLSRHMRKMESELQEADEICELFNLQMEKMQAAFDAEREALKEEAAKKALDYESAVAKLTGIAEQQSAQETHPREQPYLAVQFDGKLNGEAEKASSRCLKVAFTVRRSLLFHFILLSVILLVLGVGHFAFSYAKPKLSANGTLIASDRRTEEQKAVGLDPPRRKFDAQSLNDFYIF